MPEPEAGPRVSVVVVSYNTRDLLLSCLRALEADRPRSDLEIIVVDNASGDGSAQAVRDHFPAVDLIASDRNLLYARGANLGAARARGEFVAILNADAEVSLDQLDALVTYLQERPEVGLAGPLEVDSEGRMEPHRRRRDMSPLGMLLRLDRVQALLRWLLRRPMGGPVGWLKGTCLVVRGDLGRRLGWFDEGFPFYWEDVDLCTRAWRQGYQVHLVDHVTILHHGGVSTDQVPSLQSVRWAKRGFVRYVRKHHTPLWANLIIGVRLARYLPLIAVKLLLVLVTLGRAKRLVASTARAMAVAGMLWHYGFRDRASAQSVDLPGS